MRTLRIGNGTRSLRGTAEPPAGSGPRFRRTLTPAGRVPARGVPERTAQFRTGDRAHQPCPPPSLDRRDQSIRRCWVRRQWPWKRDCPRPRGRCTRSRARRQDRAGCLLKARGIPVEDLAQHLLLRAGPTIKRTGPYACGPGDATHRRGGIRAARTRSGGADDEASGLVLRGGVLVLGGGRAPLQRPWHQAPIKDSPWTTGFPPACPAPARRGGRVLRHRRVIVMARTPKRPGQDSRGPGRQ